MTASEPISKELQAKIDALDDDVLRKNIIMVLSGSGVRKISNEKIFDNMIRNHEEVRLQRALWRVWRDDEVLDFVEFMKKEAPDQYAEFARQERVSGEIDDDLWWEIRELSSRWVSDLDFHDCSLLLGKVRDHFRAKLK